MWVLGLVLTLTSYSQTPIITNVVDGTCGSDVKFVELYISGTVNMADYKLVRRSNANLWIDGADIDISALGSRTDEFVYLIRDLATLNSEFPSANITASNSITDGGISHNGDDSYRLVEIAGDVVIDQFGGDNDGTGEPWEYTDSWSSRNDGEGPNPTFTMSEWTFNAIDILDNLGLCNGESTPFEDTVTNIGTYMPMAVATGPTTSSPTPTQEQADVVSIFSDEYTGNTGFTSTTFGVGGNNSTGEFQTIASNEVFKITYDGGDFIGLEFDEAIDASAMENFHVDVWIEGPIPVGAVSIYKWSNHGGGHLTGETDSFTSTQLISEGQDGQWLSFDIPLDASGFPGQTGNGTNARSILSQLVINSASADGTYGPFYFDNLYFWKEPSASGPATAAPDPTEDSADVISLYSGVYTNVPVDTWLTPWSQSQLEDIQIDGNDTKLYTNLDFAGIETVGPNAIDASDMDYFHMDVWSPNAAPFRVKLVDLGAGVEGEIAFDIAQGEWVSLQIPLDDFADPVLVTNPGNLLTSTNSIQQYIISGLPVGAVTAYVDNVYFSKEPAVSEGCLVDEFGQWPGATFTPDPTLADGLTVQNITTGGWAGEYSKVEVLNGETYKFSGSIDTDYHTISNEAGDEVFAAGVGPVIWVADADQVIRFWTHTDESCGFEQSSRTRAVTVGLPPSCLPVFSVTFDEITTTGAGFSWEAQTNAVDYTWMVFEQGADPEVDDAVAMNTTTEANDSVDGLQSDTNYFVIIKTNCGDEDGESIFSAEFEFKTAIEPTIVSVEDPALESYCYDSGEFKEWLFESNDGSPLTIEFSQGSVETFTTGSFDDLIIYDGQDNAGIILFDSDEDVVTASDLTGLTLTAESGFIYMTLETDGSVSCASGSETEIQFEVSIFEPTFTSVQVIHNSPDPAAASVDVYLNGEPSLLMGVDFRTASPFVDAPAGVDFTIDVVPADGDITESVYSATLNLDEDVNYIIVANGVLSPDDFVTDNDFELSVFAGAKTAADDPTGVEVLVHHGSPDAPAVDVNESSVTLVSNISYPEFQGYLPLPVADYVLEIAAAGSPDALVAYQAPLATLGGFDGAAITVVASGFFGDDAGDNNGFGLWVATADGGPLLELPLVEPDSPGCLVDEFGQWPGATFIPDPTLANGVTVQVITTVAFAGEYSKVEVLNGETYKFSGSIDTDYHTISNEAGDEVFAAGVGPVTWVADADQVIRFWTHTDENCGFETSTRTRAVTVGLPPNCLPVSNVMVSEITTVGADLSWDAQPNAVDYTWMVFEQGADPEVDDAVAMNTTTETSDSVDGLQSDTNYFVIIKTNCGDEDGESIFSTPVEFKTAIEPTIVSIGNPALESYCYDNGEFKEWLFESFDGSPLTIEFSQGSVETFFDDSATFDDLIIYDGQNDTGIVLFNSDDEAVTANDLTGLTLIAESGFIYMTLDTDGSISCASGAQTEIIFEVSIQTIGTSQFNDNNFSFYPNPANNRLNLQTTGQVEEVKVFNMLGQQVMKETPKTVSPSLNVEALQVGTYIMNVTIDGTSANFRFIKE